MAKYRLTDSRRAELISEHIDEFGTDGTYSERALEALRRCPDIVEVPDDFVGESMVDLERRMHEGRSTPDDDPLIVILCEEYRMGHTTLPEVL